MPCSIYEFQSFEAAKPLLDKLVSRHAQGSDVESQVRDIINAVQKSGDSALLEYTKKFDCADFSQPLRLDSCLIAKGLDHISEQEIHIINTAIDNIRVFHEAQKNSSWFITRPDGTVLGQRISAVDRAGLYIPGGKAGNTPLISSLLMQAIPAQVAGVKQIAMVSPPRFDASLNPHLLAAAHLLGIDEIYSVGGPWAIAALAYGTESIPKVDVITGPGNTFVTTAKKLVQGEVGIDMLAGPSEILIFADDSLTPFTSLEEKASWIAADMLSQAEHDTLASSVCICTEKKLALAVNKALTEQVATLPRKDIALASLKDWGAIILSPSLELGVAFANAIAPEHMEILTQNPWETMGNIDHAGAIFLGPWSPEPVGDYFAGTNHVLPTQGAARYTSALGVQTFTKRTNIIAASQAFTLQSASSIAHLARCEALEAHARSVEIRTSKN